MSATATIFNPNKRPVPYSTSGLMLGGHEKVEADTTDPVCALALEQGHLKIIGALVVVTDEIPVEVVAPQQPVEVTNSEVVATEPSNGDVAEPDASAGAEEISGAEAEEAKPTPRKKTATQQATKE
jgi:hypothetical protein